MEAVPSFFADGFCSSFSFLPVLRLQSTRMAGSLSGACAEQLLTVSPQRDTEGTLKQFALLRQKSRQGAAALVVPFTEWVESQEAGSRFGECEGSAEELRFVRDHVDGESASMACSADPNLGSAGRAAHVCDVHGVVQHTRGNGVAHPGEWACSKLREARELRMRQEQLFRKGIAEGVHRTSSRAGRVRAAHSVL